MNAEIFAALRQLEKERGIPVDYMVERITQALVAAYKKDKDGYTDNVYVELTEDKMFMYAQKEVVDEVITPATEIQIDAARKIDKNAQLGDLVNVEIKTQAFGRIAAQTAKQVIIQGIREAERGMIFESFSSRSMRFSRVRFCVSTTPATSLSASGRAPTVPTRCLPWASRYTASILPKATSSAFMLSRCAAATAARRSLFRAHTPRS